MLNSVKKPLLDVLNGVKPNRIPVWLMRQAGRYLPEYRFLREKSPNFIRFCLNPDLATEATLQPIRRFDIDAAILFSDILIIPYALGGDVCFNPSPKIKPIRIQKDLNRLSFDNFEKKCFPVGETVSRVSQELLNSKKTLIGFCGSPWTVACYMVEGEAVRDFPETRYISLKKPDFFSNLIDLLVEATIQYLHLQIKNGAEVIKIFDSWAGILEEEEFERWVIDPTRRIVKELRKYYSELPIIGFPKNCGVLYKKYAEETGVSALAFDSQVPLDWASKTLQPILPLQGNLDPMILKAGEPMLKKSVYRIMNKMTSNNHGFIFNLGHGVDKETPINHVVNLLSYIREFEKTRYE